MTFDGFDDIMSVFSYGDPSANPAEFTLTENKYAHGPNQEVVGFVKPLFAFGSNVDPTSLQLDSNNKPMNGRFHSCKVTSNSEVHRIFYEMRTPIHDRCFEVDIYFLRQEKLSETLEMPQPLTNLTWAFFAKTGNKFVPLTRDENIEMASGVTALSYKELTSDAAEFSFEYWYVAGIDEYYYETVGIYNNLLSVGTAIRLSKLELDNDWRVLNSKYYSCPDAHDRNIISDISSSDDCFKVDIYFLRYDKKVGTAAVMPFSPKQEASKVTSEEHNFSDSLSVTPNLPFMFFVKYSGVFKPLSAKVIPQYGNNFSMMCLEYKTGKPIEFTMEGSYALSLNTATDRYFGVNENIVGVGPQTQRMKLILDEHWKVRNTQFYKCWDINDNEIIGAKRISDFCFEVDIYLLHLDPSSGQPITDVRSPELIEEFNRFEQQEKSRFNDVLSNQASDSKGMAGDETREVEILDGNEFDTDNFYWN